MVGEKRSETAGSVIETRRILVERAHSAGGVGVARRVVVKRALYRWRCFRCQWYYRDVVIPDFEAE